MTVRDSTRLAGWRKIFQLNHKNYWTSRFPLDICSLLAGVC